jgi:hypothetical protein
MCVFRTKETPMELDALEAVRRLTLERDALAEQVNRLEDSVTWYREELKRTRAVLDALARVCACGTTSTWMRSEQQHTMSAPV